MLSPLCCINYLNSLIVNTFTNDAHLQSLPSPVRNTGYTAQVLGDALTYADHAGRSGSVQMEDVTLAIQSRVGWEFGGRVPKEVCRYSRPRVLVIALRKTQPAYPIAFTLSSGEDKC